MDTDTTVKLAVYHFFARTGLAPSPAELGLQLKMDEVDVSVAYERLRQNRVLWLEPDGHTIRMAPPFSAVPTQHRVVVKEQSYFANCAWDALGIPAALKHDGTVFSRCEQSGEPLEMEVSHHSAPTNDWLFHCLVPAAQWWQDLPFT